MSDAIQWVIDLVDRVSSPADAVSKSMRKIDSSLNVVQQNSAAVTGALDAIRNSVSQLSMMAIARAAINIGSTVFGYAKQAATFAIEAASFRRNAEMAFELIEGTPEKAKETLDKIEAIANKTPFKTDQVIDIIKNLRSAGMDQKSTEDLFMAMSDIASSSGAKKDETLARLSESIIKLRSAGKLSMEELQQIGGVGGGVGVNVEALIATLAKQQNKTVDQVKQMVSAGNITSAMAIEAFKATVQEKADKGGPLGKATETFGIKSLEGAISTLQSAFSRLFNSIDIGPLVNAINTLNNFFSSSEPEIVSIREQINATFKSALTLMESFASKENVTSTFKAIAAVVGVVSTVVIQVVGTIGSILSNLVAGISPFAQKIMETSALGAAFTAGLSTLGRVANVLGQGLGMVAVAAEGLISAVLPHIVKLIQGIMGATAGGALFEKVIAAVGEVCQALGQVIGLLVPIVLTLVTRAIELGTAFENAFRPYIPDIRAAGAEILAAGKSLSIFKDMSEQLAIYVNTVGTVAGTYAGLLSTLLGPIGRLAVTVVEVCWTSFYELYSVVRDLGLSIATAIASIGGFEGPMKMIGGLIDGVAWAIRMLKPGIQAMLIIAGIGMAILSADMILVSLSAAGIVAALYGVYHAGAWLADKLSGVFDVLWKSARIVGVVAVAIGMIFWDCVVAVGSAFSWLYESQVAPKLNLIYAAVSWVTGGITSTFWAAIDAVSQWWPYILMGLFPIQSGIIAAIYYVLSVIDSLTGGMVSRAYRAGVDYIRALWDGMMSIGSAIFDWLDGLTGGKILGAVKDINKIIAETPAAAQPSNPVPTAAPGLTPPAPPAFPPQPGASMPSVDPSVLAPRGGPVQQSVTKTTTLSVTVPQVVVNIGSDGQISTAQAGAAGAAAGAAASNAIGGGLQDMASQLGFT